MFLIEVVFYFVFVSLTISFPQINLHLTDWENDLIIEHDCLHVAATIEYVNDPHQIISYCLTDFISKLDFEENYLDQKFTFAKLSEENVTSEELYLWSAPIDLIEEYELYLNQTLISNDFFYNCTPPRFGPFCQYSFDFFHSDDHSSLNELIFNYYQEEYLPTSLTCYKHLECDRGSSSLCLDWSEICDGYIDCLNNGVDEKFCSQLEINKCKEDEYRCFNGQCISKRFVHDDLNHFECLDKSDESIELLLLYIHRIGEPIFNREDITCTRRYTEPYIKVTSSCEAGRDEIFKKKMLKDTPNSVSDDCWLAFRCYHDVNHIWDSNCDQLCVDEECQEIIYDNCPDLLIVPAQPLAFGHIYVAFRKTTEEYGIFRAPDYVCYNEKLCSGFLPNKTLLSLNHTTCRRTEDFPVRFSMKPRITLVERYLETIYSELNHCNTIDDEYKIVCDNSMTYQCIQSSKCISKFRLCDGQFDCDYKDDEQCLLTEKLCSSIESEFLFNCSENNKCISRRQIDDGRCSCIIDNGHGCADENLDFCNKDQFYLCDRSFRDNYIKKHISFPTICDGFNELVSVNNSGQYYTDETECQYWSCNNIYTRCNQFWNCFDGADEINCLSSPLLECPIDHHLCVSFTTYQLTCLPIGKANNGQIDCVGATDEPKLCRSNNHIARLENFYCENDVDSPCVDISVICLMSRNCIYGDKQRLCNMTTSQTSYSFCDGRGTSIHTDRGKFFCKRPSDRTKASIVHFSLNEITNSTKQILIEDTNSIVPHSSDLEEDYRCHRGLPVRLWFHLNPNLTRALCFCPSNYYGDSCQYQNQRISLTLKFQVYSDSRRTLFSLIISLIDSSDQRTIHSYKQLTYLYTEHCQNKFNMYLIYSKRPKDLEKNYSIHIDIYEKISFQYRGSLLIPITYLFLPVYRIALLLNIPRKNYTMNNCSNQQCIYGECVQYVDNSNALYFCQCHSGWTGKFCTISYKCKCSSDALCVGIAANNRSICICPLNKWGPRCLLRKTICELNINSTCYNDGQCVPIDDTIVSKRNFLCICPKGFSGERCEIIDKKLIISFDDKLILPDVMLVHFIEVIKDNLPRNGSTYKIIPLYQKSILIHWSRPFHIVFAELFDKKYYLIDVQQEYNRSETIFKTINSSDRCGHFSEFFNETITKSHLLRRIKFYHLPCQNRSSAISCFYDETYFCICYDFGRERLANCLEFNSSLTHNCFGRNYCENGAKCLQDSVNCPQTSICVCPECFYGRQCQFSSSAFDLSLDAILGYHIQPNVTINNQSTFIRTSVALTTIVIIMGLINGILSLLAFRNKQARQVGCGYYLLGSTITTLSIVVIFALKFGILMSTQIGSIENRLFLKVQCFLIDFLLGVCFNMDKWLNACIAAERASNTIKGVSFDRKKSKKMAKYIIIFLILLTIGTTIHDPIYRRLSYDEDDDNENLQRTWCIVTYSSNLYIYNKAINMSHFFIPFFINIISSIIIILTMTRRRTNLQRNSTYRILLYKQLRAHGHLLIAPIVLVILALPRLIISFVSGCMKSTSNVWLFFIGYLISFIPSMLTFVVFVLPSKLYKKEVKKSLRRYQQTIQKRLNIISCKR